MKKVFVVVLLFSMLMASCVESSSSIDETALPTVPANYADLTNPLSEDAAAVAGAEIFATNCATCHGSSGHGDGPAGAALNPQPKDLSVLQVQVSDGYLFWRISEGSPGTAMVAWRGILSDEQIWQLTAFIRTLE